MDTIEVFKEIDAELNRAYAQFPNFHSPHEGFAVLKEEVDELWLEVRGKSDGPQGLRKLAMRKEAIQVAAMAIRFIRDCT